MAVTAEALQVGSWTPSYLWIKGGIIPSLPQWSPHSLSGGLHFQHVLCLLNLVHEALQALPVAVNLRSLVLNSHLDIGNSDIIDVKIGAQLRLG